jgi:hypothetical protein
MIKYTSYNYVTKTYETYIVGVGTTMYVHTEAERVMSDVWEYVTRVYYWDGERINSVYIGYYGQNKVEYTIDADFDSILPQVEAKIFERNLSFRNTKADDSANQIHKGTIVRVARGRKEVGKVGKVVSIKDGQYGTQLAIALDDTKGLITARDGSQFTWYTNVIWIAARNCVVDAPMPDYVGAVDAAKYDTQRELECILQKCKLTA